MFMYMYMFLLIPSLVSVSLKFKSLGGLRDGKKAWYDHIAKVQYNNDTHVHVLVVGTREVYS